MRFFYTPVGAALYRPLIPLLVRGPTGSLLSDGVLDPGADRTILSPHVALRIGIDVGQLTNTVGVTTPVGVTVLCKTTQLILELIQSPTRITWVGEVAIPLGGMRKSYWGFRGFLEFFRAEFDGPNRIVTLSPGTNLPAVAFP